MACIGVFLWWAAVLFATIRTANEPDPRSVPVQNVQKYANRYGLPVKVKQVLYVNSDSEMQIFSATLNASDGGPLPNRIFPAEAGRLCYTVVSETVAGVLIVGIAPQSGCSEDDEEYRRLMVKFKDVTFEFKKGRGS